MLLRATKSWDELARAIIEDILEKQGGFAAVLPFFCLIFILFAIGVSWYLLRTKQKEIDRMAGTREDLERQVISKRASTKS